jgi:PDZ domain
MPNSVAALASLIVLGISANTVSAKNSPLLSLSMEHFRDTAIAKDDPANGTTTITTEKGFVVRTGPMKMVWNDEYLKGVIDRNTGQKSFQVIAMTIYSGNRRFFQTANYQWVSGPKSVPATQISTQRDACAVGDCVYTEYMAFAVDEADLRQIAAGNAPGKPTIWPFKITAKPGPDYSGELSSAEIAGFLAKVDLSATAVPVAKANAAIGKESAASVKENAAVIKENAASASLKLDLGIVGMPVAAAPEQPSRAGILIIGVNSGSAAQKSGIIIGDIVYEFDGHPLKGLAELEAAVAACAPNSTVGIKLYRGTNKLTLTARF